MMSTLDLLLLAAPVAATGAAFGFRRRGQKGQRDHERELREQPSRNPAA